MNNLVERFQEAIEKELERLLYAIRVLSFVGLLAGFWFTPWPWKGLALAPFVLPPVLFLLSRLIPATWTGPDRAAQEAELVRIRTRIGDKN